MIRMGTGPGVGHTSTTVTAPTPNCDGRAQQDSNGIIFLLKFYTTGSLYKKIFLFAIVCRKQYE